jgi:hypothetical protein
MNYILIIKMISEKNPNFFQEMTCKANVDALGFLWELT